MVVWQIDDDPLHLQLAEMIIRRVGLSNEIRSFTSAARALATLKDSRPDLILLDLRMPDMDGWQFLDAVRNQTDAPPVIIVTSSIDPREQARARENPRVQGWIEKPIRVEELVALIAD